MNLRISIFLVALSFVVYGNGANASRNFGKNIEGALDFLKAMPSSLVEEAVKIAFY